MAMSANQTCGLFSPPRPTKHKRATAGTCAAGVRIFNGALCIAVDGVARPAVSGSTLKDLGTLIPGAGADGGLYVRAMKPNVRFATVNGTAGIAIAYGATYTDVTLTYANNTTAAAALQILLAHAEVRDLLRFAVQGTGASNIAAAALAAMPFIEVLGVSRMEINNAGGGSALQLPADALFDLGAYGLAPVASSAPAIGPGAGWIYDDASVTKAASSFDLRGDVVGKTSDSAFYFVDLETVR